MMRLTLATLVLTAGLALSSVALAHGPGGPKGPPPPLGPLMHGLQQLELDADQQLALDDTLAEIEATRPEPPSGRRGPPDGERPTREEMEAHKAERQARAEQLEAELAKADPNAGWLHAQLDGGPHGAAPTEAHDHLDLLLGVHALLSAEQRATLVQDLAEGRARHEERCADREGPDDRGDRARRRE